MLFSIGFQLRLFIFSILAGILTGILFDIYRLIRGSSNPNKVITVVEDILFWIFTSILVFTFLLYTNYAYVSIYIYLLIFIGMIIYLNILSDLFIVLLYNLNKFIYKIIRISFKYIMFPIEFILYKINKSFKD